MRLQQLNYDENERLEFITINLNVNESLAIVNILGKLNVYAHNKLGINSDMYDCLASIFNKEDEDGYKDLGIEISTLNDKPHQ